MGILRQEHLCAQDSSDPTPLRRKKRGIGVFWDVRPIRALAGVVLILAFTKPCRADEVFTFIVKKQEQKAKNRWTLADWLETRDRMRLMDLWLAIHSPSPYEFFVFGEYLVGREDVRGDYRGWRAGAAAYATILGLELQGEQLSTMRWLGMLNLRIFGYHAQGTNITLHGGLANREGSNSVGFLGASVTLYFSRYFGVDGMYRHFFTSGKKVEAGGFIDFSALRVYGRYEAQELAPIQESGVAMGLKLFL